jgi:L-malate glycosyltransferase
MLSCSKKAGGFAAPRGSKLKVPSHSILVALVAPSLDYVGGQAVQADLLRRQWENDPDVQVKFVPIDPNFPPGFAWLKRLPVLRTIIREPLYLLNLWRELKNVEIVHIFSASYWSFLLAPAPALFFAGVKRKKALVHYHSGEARDHLQRFRTARSFLGRAELLVVPSCYLAEVFGEFGFSAEVVPNIVDLSQFSFRVRRPLRPHLVCTRGFHTYYCVDVVIRAFVEIKREFPQARLDLVGSGPLEPQVRQLVEQLGLAGVTFPGVASRHEIGQFYNTADVFINASRLDNMPVSILEAFASGTPVVSTDPEGMRYVIDNERTGLLSPVGDAKALAHNAVRLLRDSDLSSRIALNAYEQSKSFRWDQVRPRWLAIYESLRQTNRASGYTSAGRGTT